MWKKGIFRLKVFAFIFARGGSKGIPKKNIKMLMGKPLIAYSIDLAKKIESIDKIFVSTDDPIISKVASSHGAKVINRPADLARDDSPEWLSWKHAIKWVENKYGNFNIFLSLPPTSPLRSKIDVENCLKSISDKSDVIVGITKSSRSPWFNMVKKNKNNSLSILMDTKKRINNRQESPDTFDLTTIAYVTTPDFIKKSNGVFDGKVFGVEISPDRAIDIDTKFDFEIAEYLINKNKQKI